MSTRPNGFVKHDSGKLRLSWMGFRAIWHALMPGRYGGVKYDAHNWRKCQDYNDYLDAGFRHRVRHEIEGPIDPETGLLHLAHYAWNALAALELYVERYVETGEVKISPKTVEEILEQKRAIESADDDIPKDVQPVKVPRKTHYFKHQSEKILDEVEDRIKHKNSLVDMIVKGDMSDIW